MNRIVFRQLQDLDHVRGTGLAPERWRVSPHCRNKQKKKNLRKIKKLIRFTKTTRFMEDDDTRAIVLRELEIIRVRWETEYYPEGED
jgi:hypothetical protein